MWSDECDWKRKWESILEHKAQTRRRETGWGIGGGEKFCFSPSVRFVNQDEKCLDFEICYFSRGMRCSGGGAYVLCVLGFWVVPHLLWCITVFPCFMEGRTVHSGNLIVMICQKRWSFLGILAHRREWEWGLRSAVFHNWYIWILRKYFEIHFFCDSFKFSVESWLSP